MSDPDGVWSLLRVDPGLHDVELVADCLMRHGVSGIEEVAESGRSILRVAVGDDPRWLEGALTGEFPGIVTAIEEVSMSVARVWRDHAEAFPIDERLWIAPAWKLDAVEVGEGVDVVLVDPEDTFGMGDHPTTVLALRLALAHVPRGARVHDHGAGSGVLGIALAKILGCAVSADDIQPGAEGVVERNARRNEIAPPTWTEGLPDDRVDAVVANILAPVLRDHAARIEQCVREGGHVVLSGMRADQVDAVTAMYVSCTEVARESLSGWVAVVLRRL